jgi:hypothetical protein
VERVVLSYVTIASELREDVEKLKMSNRGVAHSSTRALSIRFYSHGHEILAGQHLSAPWRDCFGAP